MPYDTAIASARRRETSDSQHHLRFPRASEAGRHARALDDFITTVEELETDPAVSAGSREVKTLREAPEHASDAADAVDEQLSNLDDDASGKG